MKLFFLGTGGCSGWPNMFCKCKFCKKLVSLGGKNIRMRTSLHIDKKYKIDFPPDSFAQMLKYKLDFSKIEHIFITHEHYDHFFPEDILVLRDPLYTLKPINLYGNKAAYDMLFMVMKRADMKRGSLKKLNIKFNIVLPFKTYQVDELKLIPIKANHNTRQPLNYIIKKRNKTVLIAWYTGWYPEETWKKLKKFSFDAVFMDCSCMAKPYESGGGHNSIDSLLRAKERLTSMGCLKNGAKFIASHFGHVDSANNLLHHELQKALSPYGVEVAYDGMECEV